MPATDMFGGGVTAGQGPGMLGNALSMLGPVLLAHGMNMPALAALGPRMADMRQRAWDAERERQIEEAEKQRQAALTQQAMASLMGSGGTVSGLPGLPATGLPAAPGAGAPGAASPAGAPPFPGMAGGASPAGLPPAGMTGGPTPAGLPAIGMSPGRTSPAGVGAAVTGVGGAAGGLDPLRQAAMWGLRSGMPAGEVMQEYWQGVAGRRAEKPGKREMRRAADDRWRYADTGELVYPDVTPAPAAPRQPSMSAIMAPLLQKMMRGEALTPAEQNAWDQYRSVGWESQLLRSLGATPPPGRGGAGAGVGGAGAEAVEEAATGLPERPEGLPEDAVFEGHDSEGAEIWATPNGDQFKVTRE